MKFLKSTIAAAAMLGTMAVTPAWADFSFTSECGGQSFSTCASGSLTTSYNAGTGLTTVTIDITHEGTNGELFKAVGLIGVPAGSTVAFVSAPTGYGAPSYPPPYGTPQAGYGPPPSGYPAPDYSAYGRPAQKTNSMAIASLVASLVGFLCWLGSIAGIVLGIVAINQIKQTREGGHGLAVAGIAIGAVSLIVGLVWFVVALTS